MKAAIYARQSADHREGTAAVQVPQARDCICALGWTVEDRHVYVDSGVSRAEYVKRPNLHSMLNAAQRGEFKAIVVHDLDQLGGDVNRNGRILSDLIDRGIQVHTIEDAHDRKVGR